MVEEAARLKALRDMMILNTEPNGRFDRISAFAARESMCRSCPMRWLIPALPTTP